LSDGSGPVELDDLLGRGVFDGAFEFGAPAEEEEDFDKGEEWGEDDGFGREGEKEGRGKGREGKKRRITGKRTSGRVRRWKFNKGKGEGRSKRAEYPIEGRRSRRKEKGLSPPRRLSSKAGARPSANP
jgi:hypothetical protein